MGGTMGRRILFAFFVLILAGPAANATESILIGLVGKGSSLEWPIYIAQEKKFFESEGVTVTLVSSQSSAGMQQQLAAGSVNMGGGGLVDLIRAIDKGAPIAIFAIEATTADYTLLAKPQIKTYADLKGKTVIVGGAKDITRMYLDWMASANGLKPGDYDMVYAGASSARFSALLFGAVDSALVTSLFGFRGEAMGYSNLGLAYDYVKDFPFTGYDLNTNWAKEHKPAIIAYLKGFAKAVDWFYDPANKKDAVEILSRANGSQPEDGAKTYDIYRKVRMFDAGSSKAKSIGNLLKIMVELGDLSAPVPPVEKFYDLSYQSVVADMK